MPVSNDHPALAARPIDRCLAISAAHARIQRVLDEELGTLHGLAYADFLLLTQLLHAPDHRLPTSALASPMGVRPSALVRQLLPLEKTGWLQRDTQADSRGRRHVQLRPAGRGQLLEATETVRWVCEGRLADVVMPR